ncbi:P2Y purinoceptor 12 [Biomphalaria glabrata]|nr:P2Y purinoceptor 12 [Biomphalaria glabrata]
MKYKATAMIINTLIVFSIFGCGGLYDGRKVPASLGTLPSLRVDARFVFSL